MNDSTVKRKSYEPTGWNIISTYLLIQIYANYVRTTIKLNVAALDLENFSPFVLYGQDLKIEFVQINDAVQNLVEIQHNDETLTLNLPHASNEIEIVTLCNPFENKALEFTTP